jgi:predicted acylesterase/phospholipase RssA
LRLALCVALLALTSLARLSAAGAQPDCRIGLALSGGGALGLAHIGVIKVLEAESIPFCYVSGNSMGSIVGGLYACGYSGAQIESIVRRTDWNRLFNDEIPFSSQNLEERENRSRFTLTIEQRNLVPRLPSGALAAENVYLYFKQLTEEMSLRAGWDFDSLVLPYRAIAVDFATGEKVTFDHGSLADAMRASMAIPGIFSPAWNNGRWLVDGGVVQFLPVEPLKEFKPDFIIAVDLRQPRDLKEIPNLTDLAWESFDIATERDHQEQLALADVVIQPDLTGLSAADFNRADELIKRGEQAARKALPELRRKLAGRRLVARRHPLNWRPRPFVRNVSILGLQRTRASVVRQEIRTRSGQPLDLQLLVDDLRRVYQTGLFYQADYKLRYVTPETTDIKFNVREREPGTYSLGIRYNETNHFLVGAEVAQNNLLGSGAGVGMGTVLGNPTEGWLRYSGARFFGLPFNYRLQGFGSVFDHRLYRSGQWVDNFREQEYGGDLKLGLDLGRDSYLKAGLTARDVFFSPESIWQHRTERIVAASAFYRTRTWYDPASPTPGVLLDFEGSLGLKPLGSQYEFMKGSFECRLPRRLGGRTVVEPNLTAGLLTSLFFRPLPLESLPIAERFAVGAPDLAGAAQEEFRTTQEFTVGVALRFRLTQLFNSRDYPLYLETDVDVGNFTPGWTQFLSLAEIQKNAYYGGAAGLRMNTPVGPVQVGLGINRLGVGPDLNYRIYVSIGHDLLQDFPR